MKMEKENQNREETKRGEGTINREKKQREGEGILKKENKQWRERRNKER